MKVMSKWSKVSYPYSKDSLLSVIFCASPPPSGKGIPLTTVCVPHHERDGWRQCQAHGQGAVWCAHTWAQKTHIEWAWGLNCTIV